MLLKSLKCIVSGHVSIESGDIVEQMDDACTVQEVCDRCRKLLRHYTIYYMTNQIIEHKFTSPYKRIEND